MGAVGANQECPCGSGEKYKRCCRDKIDWPSLLKRSPQEQIPFLSARGRNLAFLSRVADILQIETLQEQKGDWAKFKAAFTAAAIRSIYEAVLDIWPADLDWDSLLKRERISGSSLYVGDYDYPFLQRGISRHSLYAQRIFLVDPLIYPLFIKPEFNPIGNPEKFRTTTFRAIQTWLSFVPWILSGLVAFIRTPSDFDLAVHKSVMLHQRQKFETNVELNSMLEEWASAKTEALLESDEYMSWMLYSYPNDALERLFFQCFPDKPRSDFDAFLKYVDAQRSNHAFFMGPMTERGEFHIQKSGTSYLDARLTAALTGSYLVTDIRPRWKEIELDRDYSKVDVERWSPFAKAFQGVPFHYLDSIDVTSALRLREQGRLERLRSFFRQVWMASRSDADFGDENVANLTAELHLRIAEAEEEWKEIDRDLMKWSGGEALMSAMGAVPLVAEGNGMWAAGGLALAGAINVAISTSRRWSFDNRYPAAMLMRLAKRKLNRGC